MIKYELHLKYQKLKSSNKDGLIFLSFSVHILCLIEKKKKKPSSFMAQYWRNSLTSRFLQWIHRSLLPLNFTFSSSNLFCLHSWNAATITGLNPQPQDSNCCGRTCKRTWDLYGLRTYYYKIQNPRTLSSNKYESSCFSFKDQGVVHLCLPYISQIKVRLCCFPIFKILFKARNSLKLLSTSAFLQALHQQCPGNSTW